MNYNDTDGKLINNTKNWIETIFNRNTGIALIILAASGYVHLIIYIIDNW
ncbi:hypothetical protein FHT21_000774 [Pedobacter sp. SG908]|nr:hypothetical protein [Pedobacter sp. SG908]NMN35733.1 hypothetical protein [Pedobacter sp. SG918]